MARKGAPYEEFAKRLERARAAKLARTGSEATPAQMAKAIKRSGATISQWFAGNQLGAVDQIDAIARLLGTEPGWLAYGRPDTEPPVVIYPDGPPSGASASHPPTRETPKRRIPRPREAAPPAGRGNPRRGRAR